MIVPRPAQELAIPVARKALEETGRALVVLATALGKMLASALIWHGFQKGRGLFLVHDNGILDHAMKEYRKVYGRRAKLTFFEGRVEAIEGADIVFSTFQMMGNHLHRIDKKVFAWMTVDETHHAQADTYRTTIEHFDCPRLGITATPDRKDERDIREIFGPEVIKISLEEAIARGWLPPIEYHVVTDEGFDEEALKRITQEVLQEGQRLSLQEINRRIFIRARDEKIAEIIEGYAEQTIVFCRNIDHAEHFVEFLKSAETYHSGHSRDYNRDVLGRLRGGDTRRVLSVNAFNEGVDVPEVGLIAFYRTTESETIFRQQLGRGMRPGKEKLVVLDFVGNLQRIRMLKEMADKIKKLREERDPDDVVSDPRGGSDRRFHVAGTGFDFVFSDSIVDLLTVADRAEAEFYPTWQEAATAARTLGIQSPDQYWVQYRQDPHLPSSPRSFYSDFPGFSTFLGSLRRPQSKRSEIYPTWLEAAAAAKKLGIRYKTEYKKRYKEDRRLPSKPEDAYSDFPGFPAFLRDAIAKYLTWQEASRAVVSLGCTSNKDYRSYLTQDAKLPASPFTYYEDFPGWRVFLGKEEKIEKYSSWEEASTAAVALGITTGKEYKRGYKANPSLPGRPDTYYSNFLGWPTFLATGSSRPE